MTIKPMLACSTQPDLDQITYPVLGSLKLDGIRCLTINNQALSRTLKHIPNMHIFDKLSKLTNRLDGELMVQGDYSAVESAVMTRTGMPDFTYLVFDCLDFPHHSFQARSVKLASIVKALNLSYVKLVEQRWLNSKEEVLEFYNQAIEQGYEGLILRAVNAPYKFGRSTLKQGWMLKLKPVEDAEATIIGFEEMMHNENDTVYSALGSTVRSKHKDGLMCSGKLGSFLCQDRQGNFISVGSGFTMEQREQFWLDKDKLRGKLITFKFQERTRDGSYRFPVFKGFRSLDDV